MGKKHHQPTGLLKFPQCYTSDINSILYFLSLAFPCLRKRRKRSAAFLQFCLFVPPWTTGNGF